LIGKQGAVLAAIQKEATEDLVRTRACIFTFFLLSSPLLQLIFSVLFTYSCSSQPFTPLFFLLA
jgi:hypothetical protein